MSLRNKELRVKYLFFNDLGCRCESFQSELTQNITDKGLKSELSRNKGKRHADRSAPQNAESDVLFRMSKSESCRQIWFAMNLF